MSLYAIVDAHNQGYDENMYLDSATRTYVEETGGANFIFVTKDGKVDDVEFEKLLDDSVALVSVIHVSNETGAINDIKRFCLYAKQINPKVIFHSDGVQAFGKIKVNLQDLGVDLAKGKYFLSIYQVETSKIIFDSNGGSAVSTITAEVGTKVVAPSDPVKDGYVFAGGYDNPSFTGTPVEVLEKDVIQAKSDYFNKAQKLRESRMKAADILTFADSGNSDFSITISRSLLKFTNFVMN